MLAVDRWMSQPTPDAFAVAHVMADSTAVHGPAQPRRWTHVADAMLGEDLQEYLQEHRLDNVEALANAAMTTRSWRRWWSGGFWDADDVEAAHLQRAWRHCRRLLGMLVPQLANHPPARPTSDSWCTAPHRGDPQGEPATSPARWGEAVRLWLGAIAEDEGTPDQAANFGQRTAAHASLQPSTQRGHG